MHSSSELWSSVPKWSKRKQQYREKDKWSCKWQSWNCQWKQRKRKRHQQLRTNQTRRFLTYFRQRRSITREPRMVKWWRRQNRKRQGTNVCISVPSMEKDPRNFSTHSTVKKKIKSTVAKRMIRRQWWNVYPYLPFRKKFQKTWRYQAKTSSAT